MRSHSTAEGHKRGFTLIETVIYIALLSSLLAAFIPYAYSISEQDLRLLDLVNEAEQA
ncbi:MAG: type II secretion system protein [Minisyncoccia bacterium]|jgi:prepilin-type N-terminal cleavage/methylation domain-containing protein